MESETVRLRAKEAAMLSALIDSFPETLTRQRIEELLYKNTYATNATINQVVKRLRDELQDDHKKLIRTVPKYGYVLGVTPAIEQQPFTKKQSFNTAQASTVKLPISPVDEVSENKPNQVFQNLQNQSQQQSNLVPKSYLFGSLLTIACLSMVTLGYATSQLFRPASFPQLSSEMGTMTPSDALQEGDIALTVNEDNQISATFLINNKKIRCIEQDEVTQCQPIK
ncbi:helix-turn-helix domain-containing protein [Vibrio kyushuensis]|uniref:winged helix-turn-helix domain-containing protein n=1 Tax=Vibrio kyushuensis TaxID=2910249 RepID=UPI003D0E6903